MKKKILIIIGLTLCILIIIGLVTSYKDSARARAGVEPKYTIKLINEKGSKVTYIGLGYKVIRYVGVSPKEPFGVNDNYKYGSWFMKYENPNKVEETEEEFKGKVIERINESILVEVLNKSKSFNKGDKVLVHITNYKYINMQYEKDMIVTIAFNGTIQETYPPQISTEQIYLDIDDYKIKEGE